MTDREINRKLCVLLILCIAFFVVAMNRDLSPTAFFWGVSGEEVELRLTVRSASDLLDIFVRALSFLLDFAVLGFCFGLVEFFLGLVMEKKKTSRPIEVSSS